MWDLTGTQFEKGILELRLEKRPSGLLKFPVWLGPNRGRLVAMVIFLFSAWMNYLRQPYVYMLEKGWIDPQQALRYLTVQTWILGGIAAAIYLSVFFLRQERLEVEFDRHSKSLRWFLIPTGSRSSAQEGELPFSTLAGLRVGGTDPKHKAPFGTIEVQFHDAYRPPFNELKLRFLSDDQRRIYPLNLYRLTEIKPTGEWTDPDDEIVAAAKITSPSVSSLKNLVKSTDPT